MYGERGNIGSTEVKSKEDMVEKLKTDLDNMFSAGLRYSYSTYGRLYDCIRSKLFQLERDGLERGEKDDTYDYYRRLNKRIINILKSRQLVLNDRLEGGTVYRYGGYSIRQICHDIKVMTEEMIEDINIPYAYTADNIGDEVCRFIRDEYIRYIPISRDEYIFKCIRLVISFDDVVI